MAEFWAADDLPDLADPEPDPGLDIPVHLRDRTVTTIHVHGDLL